MNNWVSCNERLPAENGYYLVTYQANIFGSYKNCVTIREFYNEKFRNCYEEWTGDDVIAWMSLPKPY